MTVTDLSVLESFCAEPLTVTSIVRGKPFVFTGRRLKPAEARQVQELLEKALPPVIHKEGEQPHYDFTDADYKKAHETYRRQARALAIWFGFPCFEHQYWKEDKTRGGTVTPLQPNVERVAEWLEGRPLEQDTLEGLFEALVKDEVQNYLGFISGNSSLKS